nr:hypothetical protein [Tanacetum cinerariifolium]
MFPFDCPLRAPVASGTDPTLRNSVVAIGWRCGNSTGSRPEGSPSPGDLFTPTLHYLRPAPRLARGRARVSEDSYLVDSASLRDVPFPLEKVAVSNSAHHAKADRFRVHLHSLKRYKGQQPRSASPRVLVRPGLPSGEPHALHWASVMPLDVLGRTRATLTEPASSFPWPEDPEVQQFTEVVESDKVFRPINNDPSAGSPTETLLRLLLPLNDQATPPGTGNAGFAIACANWPILWRAEVTFSRRNARKGVGQQSSWLKVRANPLGNQAPTIRPDKSRRWGAVRFASRLLVGSFDNVERTTKCCDALRCSGPHARYTDRANEFFTLTESKRVSSACVDYVPALCTHRPSLLPIEWLSEAFGLAWGEGALVLAAVQVPWNRTSQRVRIPYVVASLRRVKPLRRVELFGNAALNGREALAARLACSCLSGLLSGALFCGQASISLGGWIKVSVMYLSSGRTYRGDDMQPAWTEILRGNATESGDLGGSPKKSSLFFLTVCHPEIGLSGARVQWLEERCTFAAFGALPTSLENPLEEIVFTPGRT